MVSLRLFLVSVVASFAAAHPVRETRDLRIIGQSSSSVVRRQEVPGSEFQVLFDGNRAFREEDPALLKQLTDVGQFPPFMYLGCVDSRVNDGTIFKTKPGTLFTQRNIANQFLPNDPSVESTLAFAVSVLGIKHVIVMGHYGCGGVGAAIASRPTGNIDAGLGAIQNWIEPIRVLFETSSRPEVVQLRESIRGRTDVPFPNVREPGYRALVEENVKANVVRVARGNVIVNHYNLLANATSTLGDVFIHGWVYDIENGEVRDLGVSVGPPGKAIPPVPFATVAGVAAQFPESHEQGKVEIEIPVAPIDIPVAPIDIPVAPIDISLPSVVCDEKCKSAVLARHPHTKF